MKAYLSFIARPRGSTQPMTCALPVTANWLEGLDCGVDLRVLGLVRSCRSYQISAGAKLLLDSQLALVNVGLRIVFPERHSLVLNPRRNVNFVLVACRTKPTRICSLLAL